MSAKICNTNKIITCRNFEMYFNEAETLILRRSSGFMPYAKLFILITRRIFDKDHIINTKCARYCSCHFHFPH